MGIHFLWKLGHNGREVVVGSHSVGQCVAGRLTHGGSWMRGDGGDIRDGPGYEWQPIQ